jgi:hypothetical protein
MPLLAGGDLNLYSYVFNRPTRFTDASGEVVEPVSWTALGIACGSGAVLGVAATWAMAGRRPTLKDMGSGALLGCGAATVGLVSWVAAGGAAGLAVVTNSIRPAPLVKGLVISEKIRRQMGTRGWTGEMTKKRSRTVSAYPR